MINEAVREENPEILSMAKRVKYTVTSESHYPDKLYGWVSIKMKDGTVYEDKIFPTKASATNPISDDEIRAKFMKNASQALPESKTENLIQAVADLEKAEDIGRIMSLCVP